MTWKEFVRQWRPVNLTRLGIPHRTVYDWKAGTNSPPDGWQREAAEFWIDAKAGEKESGPASGGKPKGKEAEE